MDMMVPMIKIAAIYDTMKISSSIYILLSLSEWDKGFVFNAAAVLTSNSTIAVKLEGFKVVTAEFVFEFTNVLASGGAIIVKYEQSIRRGQIHSYTGEVAFKKNGVGVKLIRVGAIYNMRLTMIKSIRSNRGESFYFTHKFITRDSGVNGSVCSVYI